MRKISGDVVSTKASTLSRAAEIVSRFAAVDNGSSPAVSLYLQRTADAFNHLVHFHDKRSKLGKLQSSPQINAEEDGYEDSEIKVGKKDTIDEISLKVDEVSEIKVRKKDKKSFDETNLKGDEVEISVKKKKKKKKKRKSGDGDMKEKSSKKKKSKEGVDG